MEQKHGKKGELEEKEEKEAKPLEIELSMTINQINMNA